MAQISWPFEDIDTSETQFSLWARQFQETGVVGFPGDEKLEVIGDDSGLQVRVRSGDALVRGHYYRSTTQETLTLDSPTINYRIDAIVVELDVIENTCLLTVIKGEEVESEPVAPTLDQGDESIYQFLLAHVLLTPGIESIIQDDVTDKRRHTSQRIGRWYTANRPETPYLGQCGFNYDLVSMEIWNGSEWTPPAPDQVSPLLLMGA
jgi:hypothetical protein